MKLGQKLKHAGRLGLKVVSKGLKLGVKVGAVALAGHVAYKAEAKSSGKRDRQLRRDGIIEEAEAHGSGKNPFGEG